MLLQGLFRSVYSTHRKQLTPNETKKMTAEKAPTVFATCGGPKKRAVAQFLTADGAAAFIAELLAEGIKDEFEIKMAPRNPPREGYTKRGVWRKSGIPQRKK